jgi:hypothetical protein
METMGLWSQLHVYQGSLGNSPGWSDSGSTINLEIPNPQAGTYYVILSDSAWIDRTDQSRDHTIKADIHPIAPTACTAPSITSFTPSVGGTSSPVTMTVSGACLEPQATVCLSRTGQASLCASSVTGQEDRHKLTAQFDLSTAAPGDWTLSVTNPNTQPVSASTAFKVESKGEASLWVDIVGRSTIRTGRVQTFYIRYGNKGTVNAVGIPLWIGGIPVDANWELGFKVKEPPQPIPSSPVDWKQANIYVTVNGEVWIPLVLPVIPPGYEGELPIKITIPTDRNIQLKAWISQTGLFSKPRPLMGTSEVQPTCQLASASSLEDCFTSLLTDAIKDAFPGYDCLIDISAFYYKYILKESGLGEVGSLIWDVIGTVLDCVESTNIWYDLLKFTYDFYSKLNTFKDCAEGVADAVLDAASISSVSPEDKYGPTGWDPPGTAASQRKHWVPAGQALDYRIDFWNKEDAPAATTDVIITDTLDPSLDWSTFRFTEVGFLDKRVTLEPTQFYDLDVNNVTIDLSSYYPGQPVIILMVNAQGSFDPATGQIEWHFHALDPMTGQPPENPYAGFLPPITPSGWEIGWVSYSIRSKAGLASGTTVTNQAWVKFDLNAPNPAPKLGPFLNTLDVQPPTSTAQVTSGQRTCGGFTVVFNGADETGGSGLSGIDVYVDDLGDTNPAVLWLSGVSSKSALFRGAPGHSYGFYTRARDNAGNLEAAPAQYDATATAGSQFCVWMPLVR